MTLKEEFIILGYTKDDYDAIRNSYPISSIKDETLIEKVRDNYSFLLKLGYKREEIIKITKSLPEIYGYSTRTIEQKMKDMISLGYTRKEVINMTKDLPAIYGYSKKNMKQKKDFYDSIGLHELVSVDPKQLIQSVNLSYARYCFYKDKGIDIDMNNYRKLFVREDQFEKSNGITKQELIEKYDYDKYEEQRKMNL